MELNTESTEYNDAGNWVGILFAVQAIGSVIWAVVLPMFRSRKVSYSLSLALGGVGFVTASMFTDQYLLFISFVLIGCAWAAMLAWPFTILTNSLKSGNIGTYLGLFNGSICLPQIVGALAGGWILTAIGNPQELAPQDTMMAIAGISLFIGATVRVHHQGEQRLAQGSQIRAGSRNRRPLTPIHRTKTYAAASPQGDAAAPYIDHVRDHFTNNRCE